MEQLARRETKKTLPGESGGARNATSDALLLAASRPDEGIALTIGVVERVSEDRRYFTGGLSRYR
jgi:hypothetical protein